MTALPIRPRLAEHALVRRHVVDGAEIVVIHDERNGNLVRMGPREWDLVVGADGTRDFDALVLAAARRGAFHRVSEVRAVLDALHASGLLADGIWHAPPVEPSDPARPLDVLPGFSLTCNGSGACCTMYGSILFTPLEAARARALFPETMGGGDQEERAFAPERGATRDSKLAVALVDGACAYLASDGRCSLHVAGGERAKPRGCHIYPATFVDDGEAVRVSVSTECPCVLASAGTAGGAPLVDPSARVRGDLDPGARVVTLPEAIAVEARGAEIVSTSRASLAPWSSACLDALSALDDAATDGVAIAWSLAEAISDHGLDADASRVAITSARRPEPAAIAPLLAALAARAKGRVETADAWRGARDRSRLASHYIRDAVEKLLHPETLSATLTDPGPFRGDEAFFLRAQIHGRLFAGGAPMAAMLRDRAARVLLARVLPASLPEGDPARAHPIALVEAMMRAHGLASYATEPR